MLLKEDLIELLRNDINKFNEAVASKEIERDLSESDFSGIVLEGANFDNMDLTSSTFSDSQLTEVKFEGCDLTSVDFTRANLIECSFAESVLNGTDFSYSNVNYANFTDADMAGAIFQGAVLTNSDFSMSENLCACRFDEETEWPDNEYLPEGFDSSYSSDLSSLRDEDDYDNSDY